MKSALKLMGAMIMICFVTYLFICTLMMMSTGHVLIGIGIGLFDMFIFSVFLTYCAGKDLR